MRIPLTHPSHAFAVVSSDEDDNEMRCMGCDCRPTGLAASEPCLAVDRHPICPRCDGFIPNNDTPGAYPGAISRWDNQTEICSACGVEEAMLQFVASRETSDPRTVALVVHPTLGMRPWAADVS